MDKQSPAVEDISWGRTKVEGQSKPFKDAKCYPGGARNWDWNETGTSHKPGIQIADVEELHDHGAEVVVLAKGFHERLNVKQETLDWLEERGIEAHVLDTESAVDTYNRLAKERPVGALFHSTC